MTNAAFDSARFVRIYCPCGCGETVLLHVGTFADTEVEVEGCTQRRADGIRSVNYRKSAAIAFTYA